MAMNRILIIEDNSDIRENTVEILELNGYRVWTADNGAQGIAVASDIRPTVIVCDIQMPFMSGYEVFTTLKEIPGTAKIPFVFFTASTEKREIKMAMDLGADGYLCKPFEVSELLEMIKDVTNRVRR